MRFLRAFEQTDRGQHTPAGIDQVVAAEARQPAQARQQALADLPRDLLGAHQVDALIAAHGRIHQIAPRSRLAAANPKTGPPACTQAWCVSRRGTTRSLGGFRARSTRPTKYSTSF